MTNKSLNAHKIGIGNVVRQKGDRIKQHKKHGWNLVQQMNFSKTDDAFILEQNILTWWRNTLKLDVHLTEFDMPQGGYTETVDASAIDLPTIWAKVEDLSKVLKK